METLLNSVKATAWIFLALLDGFFQGLGTGPERLHILNNAWHKVLPGNTELWTEHSVKAGGSDPHQMQSLRFTQGEGINWGWRSKQHSWAASSWIQSQTIVVGHKPSHLKKRAAVVKRGGAPHRTLGPKTH